MKAGVAPHGEGEMTTTVLDIPASLGLCYRTIAARNISAEAMRTRRHLICPVTLRREAIRQPNCTVRSRIHDLRHLRSPVVLS